jgi:carboxyvinyl-carboxyphosphonate phosphorylmutase
MGMDWTDRRRRFRAYLQGDKCLHPGSVFDPISARAAEEIGFEIGMFAGSTGSLAVLGAPDIIVLTLTEFAQQALRINRAGSLPLLVDADHGYGNALSVMRTVQELETAGVAGMTIEDTDLPRPYGVPAPRLISLDEGVGKMRAAVAARQDASLCVFARTSAPGITGVEDTIVRAHAYAQTGVDGLFLVGVSSRAQLDAIAEAVKLPLLLGGVSGDLRDRDYLASRGVRIALQGHLPFAAGVRAVYETLRALRDGVQPDQITTAAPADMMRRLTRDSDYAEWTKAYLGG